MRSNDAEAPRGIITELREALDAIPADEPRNYGSKRTKVPKVSQDFSIINHINKLYN
jgi:hypothetical protein